jgi:hypothetical protein
MRAVSRDEMQPDPAARLGQPILHKPGVMIARVVQKNVDDRQYWIQCFERFQQPDRRGGIDGFGLDHAGFSGLQVKSAVNVDTLPPAGLLNRQIFFLGRPAANGPRRVRWMYSIQKQHRLVRAKRVQQLLVTGDERLLLFSIELAANDFWLVLFKSKPMQQGDQSGAAFVNNPKFPLDKGSNLPSSARQGLGDVSLQRLFLRRRKTT